MNKQMTAIIEREDSGYVFFCPASQGDTVQEARENLREALEFFSKPHRRKKFNIVSANRSHKPFPPI